MSIGSFFTTILSLIRLKISTTMLVDYVEVEDGNEIVTQKPAGITIVPILCVLIPTVHFFLCSGALSFAYNLKNFVEYHLENFVS